MRITMVGTGYVGLVTGTCLANTGNTVTCLDVDQAKIDKLNAGVSPIYEPGLEELIHRNTRHRRLHFTTDKQAAYQSAQVIFICVGTPADEKGNADLSALLAAARDIGDAIEAAPGYTGGEQDEDESKIIVVKSTVPVGTNAVVREAIGERTNKPFRMASNPEFLKEGAAINDFNKPDRVIIGVDDKQTGDQLRDLYDPFVRQGNPVFVMDIPSAEMVKYASNAMLATKISFINEIANLCEAYGSDIEEVRRGMCADTRIGNKFLYPGLGYGGSCFPKDVQACIGMGEETATPTPLMKAVHDVNQQQRSTFMEKILEHFGEDGLSQARVAVWGIAFKPGTDDIREAPAMTLMSQMLEYGSSIIASDPVAHDTCYQVLGDRIEYTEEPYSALDGADALVVCTDWPEFKHPDFDELRQRLGRPVIFDGRNLYRPETMAEHGFTYYSVGRPAMPAAEEASARVKSK